MRIHALIGTALVVGLACAPASETPIPVADEAVPGRDAIAAEPGAGTTDADAQSVSLIGCLLQEDAYREIVDDSDGGVLGTGLGTDDEYVLVGAILAPDTTDMSPEDTAAAYENALAESAGHAYALDGEIEENMATGTGRLVEVVGMLEEVDEAANPPAEASLDVDELPVIELTVWHEVGDFCPAPES